MNTAQNVYIQKAAFSGSPLRALREGSSVLVRVISQTGPQTYVASFSGTRFSVSSSAALKSGTTFLATVSFRDGKIALVPQQGRGIIYAEAPLVQNLSPAVGTDGLLTDQRLAAYFISIGLPPDALSLVLFNEMKELGMKFDPSVLNRVRHSAEKFEGREKEAAEAGLVLEQKGLPSGENEIRAVLGEKNDGDADGNKNNNKPQNNNHYGDISAETDKIEKEYKDITHEVRRFFTGIFKGTIPGKINSEGFLTVFNHYGFSGANNDSGSWIQIPFDISLDDGMRQGKGILRCFLQKDHQKNKKFVIKVSFGVKLYFFVLYYIKERCRKIRFCIVPNTSVAECEKQKGCLYAVLHKFFDNEENIEVEWVDHDALSGFCPEDETVSVVRGVV
ncbi:MAG: hypothetical protein M0P01_03285 [Treponema sp.]|nr:hypothetical protein [Treponema sp.]